MPNTAPLADVLLNPSVVKLLADVVVLNDAGAAGPVVRTPSTQTPLTVFPAVPLNCKPISLAPEPVSTRVAKLEPDCSIDAYKLPSENQANENRELFAPVNAPHATISICVVLLTHANIVASVNPR
jgi:hypothetical protein